LFGWASLEFVMTDYAILRTGGKQYRVRPGDTLMVEKIVGAVGDTVTISDVLLTAIGGNIAVGTPTVPNVSIVAEISEQGKGEKLNIFKYKAKTRYRRKRGHRQQLTTLLVKSIETAAPKPPARRPRSRKKAEA
jgi:large subunit ribosomal protein L21